MVHKGMSLNWSFQGSRIKRNVVHRLLSGGLFWKCFHILSVEDQIADAIDMQMLPSWRSSTEKEMLVQVFRTQKKKKRKKKERKWASEMEKMQVAVFVSYQFFVI